MTKHPRHRDATSGPGGRQRAVSPQRIAGVPLDIRNLRRSKRCGDRAFGRGGRSGGRLVGQSVKRSSDRPGGRTIRSGGRSTT